MVRVCALGLSLLLASSTAFAQVSATTGSINGKVTDDTGGVLPGVTVTASSPSMQGTRTDVTNEAGEYRFPAVPPGEYKLAYELPASARSIAKASGSASASPRRSTPSCGVASLQETVTVTGESPVVDVTSTTTATSFGEAAAGGAAERARLLDGAGGRAGDRAHPHRRRRQRRRHADRLRRLRHQGRPAPARWSKASSTPKAPALRASITTTAPSTRSPSRPRATPPRCRGPACGRTSSPSRAATRTTARFYADYQNKGIQRSNIDDSLTFLCPAAAAATCSRRT